MSKDISSSDSIIDTRDLIARIEDLTEQLTGCYQASDGAKLDDDGNMTDEEHYRAWLKKTAATDGHDFQSEAEEFINLESFAVQIDDHNTTLIRDSHFETYMDEMLEDMGDIPKDLPSYLTITVDYDALKSDYTSAEYDGETYWFR